MFPCVKIPCNSLDPKGLKTFSIVFCSSVEYLLTGQDPQGLASDERDLVSSYRRLDERDRQEILAIIAVKLNLYDGQGEKALAG
jgi:hypothetical protein